MRIIADTYNNYIETTCEECNTFFAFTLPEVKIVEWEDDDGMVNSRRKGLFKKEYYCAVYKKKKAVIHCPICKNEIRVDGYMSKQLESERVGEKILKRKELHYIIP